LLGRARDILRCVGDVRREPSELLAERQRHGVLQVRAPGLQHVRKLPALVRQALGEPACGVLQPRHHGQQCEPRRGREYVIRRLSHVDVVVRVHARVFAAPSAEQFGRAVGEHLVRVHVVRRSGACLVNVDEELIAEAACQDLVGGAYDSVGDIRGQPAEITVRFRGGLLDLDRGDDQLGMRREPANRKVVNRALRLRAVVR
jgi:hypothetical protein